MTGLSIQDTAFTGFRLVRENPRVLAFWALFALVTSLAFTAVLIVVAGPSIMRLQQLGAMELHDPAVAMKAITGLLPIYALLAPLGLLYYAIVYAAMNRAVFRPDDNRFGYLRCGGDELRQLGLMVALFVCALGAYLAFVVVAIILGVVLDMVAHLGPQAFTLIAIPALFVVFGYLAIRMSLASALTFQSGRVNVFGSWSLTRGRFWPISGIYLMTIALSAVVLFLTYLVTLAVIAVATGGHMFALLTPPDMSAPSAYFTVPQVVQLILGGGVSALIWPIVLTPPAAICRQLLAERSVS